MNFKNIFSKKTPVVDDMMNPRTFKKVVKERMAVADREFNLGYDLIQKYPRTVSILGSARLKPDDTHYKHAESIGRRIATELQYAVVTGGGPGIMEAANKGAYDAGGKSIGFGIHLPQEQEPNKYLTEFLEFEYFFSRKTLIFFAAEAYLYYPGGFGTMDELFEVLTLMQTGEISKAPVILVGKDFWEPLMETIVKEMLEDEHTISPEDRKLFEILDSEDEIMEIIKKAPLRQD